MAKYTLVAFNESQYTAHAALADQAGVTLLNFELDKALSKKTLNEVSYENGYSVIAAVIFAATRTAKLFNSNARVGFYILKCQRDVKNPKPRKILAINTYALWHLPKKNK